MCSPVSASSLRVAASPSRFGIRMSMRTRSGRRLRAREQGVLAVDRLTRDLEVGLGVDQHAQAGADQVLVVGDEDAHGHATGTASSGRRASTRKPGPSPP